MPMCVVLGRGQKARYRPKAGYHQKAQHHQKVQHQRIAPS